jgi:tetratricopeptide (TPR) repeat protein
MLSREDSIRRAESLIRRGDYAEARKLLSAALRPGDALPAANRARLLALLGIVCKQEGRFAEGFRAYRQAERALKTFLPPGSTEFATIQHNLGGLEHERRRFTRAEVHARSSVAIRKAALGARHPEVLADEAALAAILHDRRKYAEAERILDRAVRFYRARRTSAKRGERDEDLAAALHNLAATTAARGRFRRAEVLYGEALRVKRRHFGARHPEMALTLNNLAVLHMKRRDWPRAESVLREAAGMAATPAARRTRRHAITLRNLGVVLSKTGRAAEAKRLLERSAAILSPDQ